MIGKGAKAGAVRADNYEEIHHGFESDAVEVTKEALGATHIVADGIFLGFLHGVESRDTLEKRVLASGVVFFEDTAPHLEPVAFICGVV